MIKDNQLKKKEMHKQKIVAVIVLKLKLVQTKFSQKEYRKVTMISNWA